MITRGVRSGRRRAEQGTGMDGPDGDRTSHQVPLADPRAVARASGRGWCT